MGGDGWESGDEYFKRRGSNFGIGKASSDSELAQVREKGQQIRVRGKWPFLEGLTVDELARYRRRRVQGQPKDTLGLLYSEWDDEDLISEYRRAFRASSDDLLKENVWRTQYRRPADYLRLEGSNEDVSPSYREDYKKYDNIELPVRHKGPIDSLTLVDGEETMETETESSRFVAYTNPPRRPSLIRRGTSLKREGDFCTDSETYSAYVAHEGQHKRELARRPTSLKMEGELDTTTEKCEKFIKWLNVSRPELMRVPTHLKLEGELSTTTENHDKYVPFVGARRPELLRQSTNLKLEGEANFLPEYTDVFKRHNFDERLLPVKPETNLKTRTSFFEETETTDNFVNPRAKEIEIEAKLNKDREEAERKRQEKKETEKKEEEMQMLAAKLENLKGPAWEIPEYKDAYKDFPRERPKIVKRGDEIGRADGSKILSSPSQSKFLTKIDQDPEYKSKYLEYPRDRPVYRKPPLSLRPTVVSSGRNSATFAKSIYQEPTSEVKSQYIPYGRVPRVETLKMPANLRLEGNLDLEPEYKTAYCTKRDYQACTEPRMHRRRERSLSASKRTENYWLNNDNAEQFGRVNAAEDQDAFQVLSTRIHEESVIGKPPSGSSRRGSRASQIQRAAQVDVVERATVKNRSPSPTYRLHVCNVDDEPRGFGQRARSPSLQFSTRNRTPSPEPIQQDRVRSYSPSFGKNLNKPSHRDGQSFVVLDNAINDVNKNEDRRRRMDRNSNYKSNVPISRGRPRTPTNWMPPWYDSTNTL